MPNYWTECYDNLRTGWNPEETILTPNSIRPGGPTLLGQLFAYPVQGQVYAQPLCIQGVNVPGGPKNLIFIATEENWIYAYDAESPTLIWSRQLVPAGEQLVTPGDIEGCANVNPYIGITSTPVIDVSSMTMYIVAKTRTSGDLARALFMHRLYAVALSTGQDRQPAVQISADANYPSGPVAFDPHWQLQRPALLLMNGIIYIGFGAHCDLHAGTYHGWVLAYDAATLDQVGVFPSTVSGMGGIWQAGRGLAGDSEGWVYCMTGNAVTSGLDYGDAVLKLTPRPPVANILEVADLFVPCNQRYLYASDADLGSGGPMLLPDQPGPYPHLLVAAGKEGTVYLLNREDLGQYNPMPSGWPHSAQCADKAVTVLWRVLGTKPTDTEDRDALFGGPAYYSPAGIAPRIYYSALNDAVKAFYYDRTQGRLIGPFDQTEAIFHGGSIPVVSSNGDQIGTAILWVLSRDNPRVLVAYDLNPSLSLKSAWLWSVTVGTWTGSLGAPATVVNGRVYAACDNQVVVYGVVPVPPAMSVGVELVARSGIVRTIRVTVTDARNSAPIQAATVNILDSNGKVKSTGSTGSQGTVQLSYRRCLDTINGNGGKPRVVPVPCDGTVTKTGYQDAGFSAPV